MLTSWNISLCQRERKCSKTDGDRPDIYRSQPKWAPPGQMQDNLTTTNNEDGDGL